MSENEKKIGEQIDAVMPAMRANAALYHEVFTSLTAVGFTEDQAIKFVVMLIVHGNDDSST